MPDLEDFVTSLRRHAEPAWDTDRLAAFAVLVGMGFELGLGPGGAEEMLAQAKGAISAATPEEIAEILSEDESEEPETLGDA